jgi:hypothetical protein
MTTVSVRPRLDRRYDVIQSVVPQFLGARDTRADALALAEWAAKRHAPSRLVVYGNDGARVEEERTYAPE